MASAPFPSIHYRRQLGALACLLTGLVLGACTPEPAPGMTNQGPTLSAAASLHRVLPPLVEAFEESHGNAAITINYGGSGALRRQVQSGAPVDAVLFASAQDVDQLIAQGLAEPITRQVVARNEILLIGPQGATARNFRSLQELDSHSRLAIGDPDFVPAGHYARQALQQLGAWDKLGGRLIYGGDVTRVLSYVRRGEVDLAVVYQTDVLGIDNLEVLDRGNWDGAPQPVVVAAATSLGANNDVIRQFLAFLQSPVGREIWAGHGFVLPE